MLNAGIINVSNPCIVIMMSGDLSYVISFIIHQAHYEKTDWSRAFNQFTIACGSLDTPSEKRIFYHYVKLLLLLMASTLFDTLHLRTGTLT